MQTRHDIIEKDGEYVCTCHGIVFGKVETIHDEGTMNQDGYSKSKHHEGLTNPHHHNMGLGTKIRVMRDNSGPLTREEKNQAFKMKRLEQFCITERKGLDRHLYYLLTKFGEIADQYKLNNKTKQTAVITLRRMARAGLTFHQPRTIASGLAIYIAAKLELDTTVDIGKIPHDPIIRRGGRGGGKWVTITFLKRVDNICKKLDITLPETDETTAHIFRYCGIAKLNIITAQKAANAVKLAKQMNLIIGSRPTTVAAAAIYGVLKGDKNYVTQVDLEEVTGLSLSTIRKMYHIIAEAFTISNMAETLKNEYRKSKA